MLSPADILGPGGRIARRLKHYELRPQQLEMAEAVARAIAERKHLLVEAGTGVGKSFAYLVPAILATAEKPAPKPASKSAIKRETDQDEADAEGIRRIVISTHTISLQEQLIEKDLPLLRAVMPVEFTAVLVKGRGNYLSKRRLAAALERAQGMFRFANEFDQLDNVARWAKATGDGSLSMMMGDLVTLVQHELPVKLVVLKNNTLGLIKWEQMVYTGNPEYGVDLAPIDFAKVAEACGARGVHIDDPKRCREQLRDALAIDGPVVIEAAVDPFEPPAPPKITADQRRHLTQALARGEPDWQPIALTMARNVVEEFAFAQSPYGVGGRILGRFGRRGNHKKRGDDGDQ